MLNSLKNLNELEIMEVSGGFGGCNCWCQSPYTGIKVPFGRANGVIQCIGFCVMADDDYHYHSCR